MNYPENQEQKRGPGRPPGSVSRKKEKEIDTDEYKLIPNPYKSRLPANPVKVGPDGTLTLTLEHLKYIQGEAAEGLEFAAILSDISDLDDEGIVEELLQVKKAAQYYNKGLSHYKKKVVQEVEINRKLMSPADFSKLRKEAQVEAENKKLVGISVEKKDPPMLNILTLRIDLLASKYKNINPELSVAECRAVATEKLAEIQVKNREEGIAFIKQYLSNSELSSDQSEVLNSLKENTDKDNLEIPVINIDNTNQSSEELDAVFADLFDQDVTQL